MKKLVMVLLLIYSVSFATDIKLKSGTNIYNVTIISLKEGKYKIQKTDLTIFAINQSEVLEIIDNPIDPNKPSTSENQDYQISYYDQSTVRIFPNLKLLPISFIGLAVTYDYINRISLLNISLKNATGKVKDDAVIERNKLLVLTSVTAIATLINTFIAFENIEAVGKEDELSLNLKYKIQ